MGCSPPCWICFGQVVSPIISIYGAVIPSVVEYVYWHWEEKSWKHTILQVASIPDMLLLSPTHNSSQSPSKHLLHMHCCHPTGKSNILNSMCQKVVLISLSRTMGNYQSAFWVVQAEYLIQDLASWPYDPRLASHSCILFWSCLISTLWRRQLQVDYILGMEHMNSQPRRSVLVFLFNCWNVFWVQGIF